MSAPLAPDRAPDLPPLLTAREAPSGGALIERAAALVVIAVVAGFLLRTEFAVASSDRYRADDSVRLDADQRSDRRYAD